MHECNPTEYITKEEHKSLCEGRMKWAEEVARQSESDRRKLWDNIQILDEDICRVRELVPKFQWWFIGILIAIIMSNYIMPKLAQNDESKGINAMKTQLSIVIDKQAAIDTTINEIKEMQNRSCK